MESCGSPHQSSKHSSPTPSVWGTVGPGRTQKSPWMLTSLESKPDVWRQGTGADGSGNALRSHGVPVPSKQAERSARGRARGSRDRSGQAGHDSAPIDRHPYPSRVAFRVQKRSRPRLRLRQRPRRAGLVAAPKSISRLSIAVGVARMCRSHIPVGEL